MVQQRIQDALMEFWNDILTTALLGTDKRASTAVALPAQIQEAANQITQQPIDPEEQFLQLAALTFNIRQSGHKPTQNQLNFPQAEAESFPYCAPRAAQLLRDILESETTPLITLWLNECDKAQQIAHPDLLPILLNKAVQNKDLREAVKKIGGRRGEWLARLNAEWEFSAAADLDQLWQTGTLDQRRTALRNMRQTDPAKAREWLAQCWPQENANTRAELLKQLDETVGIEDESFLTDLLNEKSQKVKDAVISLLQQLPGSVVIKKYEETIRPLIFIKKEKALLGLTTKTTLQVLEAPIPEKKDELPGIFYLSGNKTFSDGEFVVSQLIQTIPPAFWEEHLGLAPDAILEFFSGKNEKYRAAFAAAARRFGDRKWAVAYVKSTGEWYPGFLRLLPPEMLDAYCRSNLSAYFNNSLIHGQHWQAEWSSDLTKAIVDHLVKNPYAYNISFYRTNTLRMPMVTPGIMEKVTPIEPRQREMWLNLIENVKKLLHLKEQTQKAFNA